MNLQQGTRLGPYEIVAPLGAGGMGEVFRARDTRLEREVAIKVLPVEFATNAALRLRFEREAKIISQLNHPHICTLHDVGDGYLVMELVDGESLADRLSRGPMPLDQVLRFGAQIAGALDRAHRRGIVHRDLKPGNIMLSKSGAKLLDFGLAKDQGSRLGGRASVIETEHKPITEQGTVVGTFQYMAPEQLEGLEADARTDIFALGCVLYEMATGRRAFQGKTKTSLIAAIVGSEPPPMSELQPLTPQAFEHVVRKCLSKDPDERWQSAHDVAEELRWIAEASAVPAATTARGRDRLAWSAAVAAMLAALAAVALLIRERGRGPGPIALNLVPNRGTVAAHSGSNTGSLTVSPNGRLVTFAAAAKGARPLLWVREIGSPAARPLSGTEGATLPFWSPDSRFLAFFADGKLKKIAVTGGPPIAIADVQLNPRSGAWNEDGVILFSPSSLTTIHRVSASGGEVSRVTDFGPGETTQRWATFLPDGNRFLYLAASHGAGHGSERNAIYAGSLDGMKPKLILHARSNVIVSKGHLLYVRDRVLLAQPFDADALELRGDPVPIAEEMQYEAGLFRANFSASPGGTLVYRTGTADVNYQLAWLDRTGAQVGVVGDPAWWNLADLSPDEKQLAGQVTDPVSGINSLWLLDLERNVRRRFSVGGSGHLWPVWSPDGSQIVYSRMTDRNWDLYVRASDGSGEERLLLATQTNKQPTDWSPDGRHIAFNDFDSRRHVPAIFILPLEGERKPVPVSRTGQAMRSLRFSPDGKWLLYLSSPEGGDPEAYVVPFQSSGGTWQISTGGALWAEWTKQGREVVYRTANGAVYAVPLVAEGSTLKPDSPQLLFAQPLMEPLAVSGDGSRFLCRTTLSDDSEEPVTLITDWTALLGK